MPYPKCPERSKMHWFLIERINSAINCNPWELKKCKLSIIARRHSTGITQFHADTPCTFPAFWISPDPARLRLCTICSTNATYVNYRIKHIQCCAYANNCNIRARHICFCEIIIMRVVPILYSLNTRIQSPNACGALCRTYRGFFSSISIILHANCIYETPFWVYCSIRTQQHMFTMHSPFLPPPTYCLPSHLFLIVTQLIHWEYAFAGRVAPFYCTSHSREITIWHYLMCISTFADAAGNATRDCNLTQLLTIV